jgi:hypothetical protein
VFDSELLKQRLRRVLVETVIAHNRTMVQLNRSRYLPVNHWGESSSKFLEFLAYESWDRAFRHAVDQSIESLVDRKLADGLALHTNINNAVEWVCDAEFALRAQVSRNLLWGLSQSLQSLPLFEDNFWYAGTTKNGYLIKLHDPDNTTESEFGKYVVGKRDGRFLCFTEKEGWKIYEFDLKQTYCVDVRRARNTEIYFDESLDDVAKQLAGEKIKGDTRFQYPYEQWEDVCAPQYALPL